MMNLKKNNFGANAIGLVVSNGRMFYALAPNDTWVVDSWIYGSPLEKVKRLSEYKDVLNSYKVEYERIKSAFASLLQETEDEGTLAGNKPLIYLDIDKKEIVSFHPERIFEEDIPEDWNGKFEEVYHLIPEEMRYWDV